MQPLAEHVGQVVAVHPQGAGGAAQGQGRGQVLGHELHGLIEQVGVARQDGPLRLQGRQHPQEDQRQVCLGQHGVHGRAPGEVRQPLQAVCHVPVNVFQGDHGTGGAQGQPVLLRAREQLVAEDQHQAVAGLLGLIAVGDSGKDDQQLPRLNGALRLRQAHAHRAAPGQHHLKGRVQVIRGGQTAVEEDQAFLRHMLNLGLHDHKPHLSSDFVDALSESIHGNVL